ncbi:AIM24 family protein [Embleya sp. NPDC050154]|uniref:AIM24 family protein n=1 Tax=unclassified Embleya TaxID=2699296 RepID=UPI00378D0213
MHGTRVLAVGMSGEAVKARNGTMIAYDGRMTFKRLSGGGEGLRGMVTRRLTGEGMTLMEVSGEGTCWFADRATEINLVQLTGETLHVESSNLLAVDQSLRTGTEFTGLSGATSGQGLFTTTVSGQGTVAVTSDGPAIVLRVSQSEPLSVDPGAYVAHTGQLRKEFVKDVNWRTFIGEGSGESVQLRFQGEGLVYVQPTERQTIGGQT